MGSSFNASQIPSSQQHHMQPPQFMGQMHQTTMQPPLPPFSGTQPQYQYKKPCHAFMRGECFRGNDCKYSHVPQPQSLDQHNSVFKTFPPINTSQQGPSILPSTSMASSSLETGSSSTISSSTTYYQGKRSQTKLEVKVGSLPSLFSSVYRLFGV